MADDRVIAENMVEQLQDEIGRLSSLKAAYKQAWSDLEDAIDDFVDDDGPPDEARQRLIDRSLAVRARLDGDR